ncbi:hypothetical protein N7462_011611 [Penicillium macrosclerotiorum]|uniref:uncharacterized protein n=1 Tax=Penicillium macrosclerotiorum TaxID=303699 RepID=UPI0025479B71|nr:uncharacterized protein N7462_011611 [Penicillium macrosclerotiorum]KAJ5662685.1 hypothetical protein N7462_011611 [Penicillium macrosclerotiorum]
MELEHDEVLEAFQRAKTLNLCPNRLWTVAGENLPKVLPDCDLTPVVGDIIKEHEECTAGFCEYSLRDFTSVQQRHECKNNSEGIGSEQCTQIQGRFPSATRDKAALEGRPTVWNLAGDAMLEPPRPYMAISHVWADGTGTGAWQAGTVNECLYVFFESIAKHFQCEGIWWDTLCIPREKAARTVAIQKIETNYEDARITLVHDLFLRSWEWDPQTACFAILMSPWFSRGWTALELTKSRKIKVIFKGRHGPVIKDLDEEILATEDDPEGPRKEASRIIRNLRKDVTTLKLNDLLTVLRSRHTSWPKDMAVISALLVGLAPAQQQQETYRRILKRFGQIPPGHLFHNAVTMSKGFSWCPTSLFEMPLDSSDASLRVLENGDLEGKWRVLPADRFVGLESRFWSDIMHPLTAREVQRALKNNQSCHLLAECGEPLIKRALLVRQTNLADSYQYIGSLTFRQEVTKEEGDWVEKKVIISGHREDDQQLKLNRQLNEEKIIIRSKALETDNSLTMASEISIFHAAIWHGDYNTFSNLIKRVSLSIPDQLGRRPLHLAAERADARMVQDLVKGVDLNIQCDRGQTALHSAVLGGSASVVTTLLQNGIDRRVRDQDGNTALHIAAQMGSIRVVELLVNDAMDDRGHNDLTPLHMAIINGHEPVVKFLEGADLCVRDNKFGWTPLHCAADYGDPELVRLLIERGAKIDAVDNCAGWTSLHVAAINGYQDVVCLLLEHGARPTKDKCGWTVHHFAEINQHAEVLKLLPSESTSLPPAGNLPSMPLHSRAINNQPCLAKLLIDKGADVYLKPRANGWSFLEVAAENNLKTAIQWQLKHTILSEAKERTKLLHYAAEHGYEALMRILLDVGADVDHKTKNGWTALQRASQRGHVAVVRLLLQAGADKETKRPPSLTRPLHLAADEGHVGVVQLLLEARVNIEAQDSLGATPLFLASQGGHKPTVQLLLEAGADLKANGENRNTPLVVAAHKGHDEVFQILLQALNNIQDGDGSNWLPLQLACELGSETITRSLLKAGADPSRRKNFETNTPLHIAVGKRNENIVRLLLEAGADVNKKDMDGRIPLHYACCQPNKIVIRLLLEAGSEITTKERIAQDTPLHAATKTGTEDAIPLLLQAGADINVKGEDEKTSLHMACEKGDIGIIRLLVDSGADIEAKDIFGSRPLHYAAGKSKIAVQILLQAGADIEARGKRGQTPLFYAINNDRRAALGLLIKSGAFIEATEESKGQTPLARAAARDNMFIVQLLLKAGADIDAKDNKGDKPIKWATRSLASPQLCRLLRDRSK